jgi:hypothetical protein
MKAAGDAYSRWTKGVVHPLNAPEYIYVVGVARALAGLPFKPGVYCEYNAADAISEANMTTHGRRLAEITKRSRPDIIVSGQDLAPKYVIEVKNWINSNSGSFSEAVNRVADIVGPRKQSVIRSGMVLFNVDGPVGGSRKAARKNLIDRMKKLQSDAQNELGRRKFQVLPHRLSSVGDIDAETGFRCWASCGLVIEPAR